MSEKTHTKEQKSEKNSEDFSFTNKKVSSRYKNKNKRLSNNIEEITNVAKKYSYRGDKSKIAPRSYWTSGNRP